MARQKREHKSILKAISRPKRRSTLFWWMVENHDAILEAAEGEKMVWAVFCAEATEIGLTDTRGQPATEGNARQTWRQARKVVEKKRAAKAAGPPKPVYPSRVPKDWRPDSAPPIVPPSGEQTPRLTGPPARELQLAPIRKEEPRANKPYDPDEQMAHLFRTFKERG